MALVIANRVREASATIGTGAMSLLGAALGYQSFLSAVGSGNTTYYAIVSSTGQWEIGLGTVVGDQLQRTTVLDSSNSGSLVNFTSGTKDVFATLPAGIPALVEDLAATGAGKGAEMVAFKQAGTGAVDRTVYEEVRDLWVSPLQFGAVGNGVANDTLACQRASDRAQAIGGTLVFPAGYTFGIQGYVFIRNGVRAVLGLGGSIKFLNDVASSGVCLLGRESGQPANVSNCRVEGLLIDCNGKIGIPIYGQNINNCQIWGNTILGVKNSPGILLRSFTNGLSNTFDNTVIGNRIFGDVSETPTSDGIFLDSPINLAPYASADAYWKATFTAADATYRCVNNIVGYNRVEGGYYGISLSAAQYNTVIGNLLTFNVRNISVQNNCLGNIITGNILRESLSSAVHLAYGSSHNNIVGNTVYTTRARGQGLLQAYVGSVANKFTGNQITAAGLSTPKWHLYCAVHSSRNEFSGNMLRGNASKAYIAVESAWDNTVTNPACYGFGESSAVNSFANAGMNQVVVKENTIDSSSAVPAIFLSQISDAGGNYSLTQCVVRGNVLLNDVPSKQLELMEETAGQLNQITLQDNTFHLLADSTKFTFPRGRAHFSTSTGNVFVNDGFLSFAANDTTPSVGIGESFQHVDTVATNVTYYDDGVDNQEILIRLSVNTTVVHNNSFIRLRGGVNATGNSNNFIRLRRLSGIWFEMWRNF